MIRIYRHGDHEAIATIFSRAIHEIACEAYTPEQCAAWSDRKPNADHWKIRCELKRPFVFETDAPSDGPSDAGINGQIAGFLELDPDGHIDCAYVNPDFQRRGVMRALVDHAVRTAFAFGLERVYVEASICARPLFEKCGFVVVRENEVTIRGVVLKNFVMETIAGGEKSD